MSSESKTVVGRADATEALLAAIVDSSADAIVGEALSGNIVYWNRAAERLFGFSSHEAIGRPGHFLAPREALHLDAEFRRRVVHGETVEPFDAVRVRKDGTTVEVSITLSPIQDATGRTIGTSRIMRDISARKAEERALRRRKEELHAFLETAHIGVHRVGADGTILWANAAELNLLGYRADEYIGHRIAEFHADQAAIDRILAALHDGAVLFEYEARMKAKDGSLKHVLIDSRVFRENGHFVHTQCFTRDITRHRAAERELRGAKLLAEQILERVTDGFIAVDARWHLTYLNRYAADVLGRLRPVHELLGRNLWQSFPELMGTVAEREYRRALAEQAPTKFEIHYPPLRGWFEVTAYPSPDGLSIYFSEITRRKELEQELHEGRELLRGIIDNARAVVFAKDLDGRFLLINRRWSELFHVAPEAMVGKTDYDVLPQDVADRIREFDLRVQRADAPLTEEERVPQDDGVHTYLSTKCPLRDRSGKCYAIIGIATDITERKQMEETLRESEERFRTLADNIAPFVWMADGSGFIFWYNKRWFDYTGTTLEEMESWGWQKVLHPDHAARVVGKIRRAFGSGIYWEDTFPLRGREGGYRWFLSHALPIRNAEGKVVRWLGTHTDITAQREAEAALAAARDRAEESERHLRAFVTASSDVVYRMNADWTVMRRLEGKHFISDTPDPSRSWLTTYIHPEDHARVLAAIDESVREKTIFELEHRVIRIDGTLGWIFSRAIPLLDDRGEITEWFGAALDITERKNAEAALQRLTEDLERIVGERTAKLRETIGELEAFSYSIAHDMRAPLRSLQGYAEVLLAEHSAQLDDEGKEYLARIGTAANRMDRLILDVLNYSRIVRSDLRLERVSLGSLIDDIIETYPMFTRDKADIDVVRPLPMVVGNDAMLTQVFSNLLGNAVKFTRPGEKPRIRIWSERRGPDARVLIQDNGIGIAADQHQKIFEVFQQAELNYGGTGIGLAIVKKAMERMGGRIGLWSEPGQGSTFWIEIPRAD